MVESVIRGKMLPLNYYYSYVNNSLGNGISCNLIQRKIVFLESVIFALASSVTSVRSRISNSRAYALQWDGWNSSRPKILNVRSSLLTQIELFAKKNSYMSRAEMLETNWLFGLINRYFLYRVDAFYLVEGMRTGNFGQTFRNSGLSGHWLIRSASEEQDRVSLEIFDCLCLLCTCTSLSCILTEKIVAERMSLFYRQI